MLRMPKHSESYNLALIGKDISKSGSPALYKELLGERLTSYVLLDYSNFSQIPKVSELLSSYNGISVTAPYKQDIFKHCDELSQIASLCKSVNCVKKADSGKIIGTLTDYDAAKEIFQVNSFTSKQLPFVILGDGAMGLMMSLLLDELKISYTIASRRSGWGDVFNTPAFYINTCLKEAMFPATVVGGSFVWDFNYDYNSIFQGIENVEYEDGRSLLRTQAIYALKFLNISSY